MVSKNTGSSAAYRDSTNRSFIFTGMSRSSIHILRILKYAAWTVATVVLCFVLLIWILFERKNDWLLRELQAFVNESQAGHLEIHDMELNLLGSFPDLEVSFQNVRYYPSRTDSFQVRPILQADRISVSMKLIPLFQEQVEISEIALMQGELWLASDSAGRLNLATALAPPVKPARKIPSPAVKPVAPKSPVKQKPGPAPATAVHVDLHHVQADDFRVSWHPYQSDSSAAFFQRLSLEINREGEILMVLLQSQHELNNLATVGNLLSGEAGSLEADLQYEPNSGALEISEIILEQSGIEVTASGQCHLKKRTLQMAIDGSVHDLKLLELIIRSEVLKRNPNLLKQGEIFVKGKIFGSFEHLQSDVSFGLQNISWKVPGKPITFENIGFTGQFISGAKPDFSQAKLSLRNIRGRLPQGSIQGQFSLVNFVDPFIVYDVDLKTQIDGYDQVFRLDAIQDLVGEISLQAHYTGKLREFTGLKQDSGRFNRLECKNISFLWKRSGERVTNLSALLLTKNEETQIQNLTFSYGESRVQSTLTFDRNLVLFLLDRTLGVKVKGEVVVPQWNTRQFIADTLQKPSIQDLITDLKFGFTAAWVPDSTTQPRFDLDVTNLSARFAKMPDIKHLGFESSWSNTPTGLHMKLKDFRAVFPKGKADINGSLTIRSDKRWQFQADVQLKEFPWTYIRDLSAELQDNLDPTNKMLPAAEMDLLTTDLVVSASIIPFPFDIEQATISADRIRYQAPQAKPIQAERVQIDLDSVFFKHPVAKGAITGIQKASGKVKVRKFWTPGFTINEIESDLVGSNDTLTLGFECKTLDAQMEQGELMLTMTDSQPAYGLRYSVAQANLESLIKEMSTKKLMSGKINYTLDLSTAGKDWATLKRNLGGTIEISGQSLLLYGIDVDNILKKYKKSQNFNLTDVGAVLVAGPIGLAVTKGTDFASLATVSFDQGEQTQIDTLYARWNLNHLQLQTEDVAFTTPLNRIAISGQLDLMTETVPGITIAVIDRKGCSLMDQQLSGKFGGLQSGKLNITKTLLGSVINFVHAVAGVDCTPVYSGRVKHPN